MRLLARKPSRFPLHDALRRTRCEIKAWWCRVATQSDADAGAERVSDRRATIHPSCRRDRFRQHAFCIPIES
jgi:hypothetical protein